MNLYRIVVCRAHTRISAADASADVSPHFRPGDTITMNFCSSIEESLPLPAAKPYEILPTMIWCYKVLNRTTPEKSMKIGSKICHQGVTLPKNNRAHRDNIGFLCFKFEVDPTSGFQDIVRKRNVTDELLFCVK